MTNSGSVEHLQMLHGLHEDLHSFVLDRETTQTDDKIIAKLTQYYKNGYDINAQYIDDTCQGSTLLQVAAYCRRPEIVSWLLHHNADVNLRHLIHVGYNAFSILCTPTITNKLATSFEARKAKIVTQNTHSYVSTQDDEEVKVIYQVLEIIANHAVAVQPACAFSLFSLISLTTLEVMPPVDLVRTVLEMVSTSSAHFFILIDIIDFFVQYQSRFASADSTKQLETDASANIKDKESRIPSGYIKINTQETRPTAQSNFMYLLDILIYQLEKLPYKQQMIENEHYKYKAVYRLLQDSDISHTCYPCGTDPADASFVVPPQHRVRPLKEINRGNIRYKNTAGLTDKQTTQQPDFPLAPESGAPELSHSNSSLKNEHTATTSDDTPIGDQTATLLSNTALPSGVEVGRMNQFDQGEDRVRVKCPRNYFLPIFFLLRSAQPHLATVVFYIQRHYYGFMQEYVQHKFRQLDLVPKLDRMSLIEFFAFLNQPGSLPHADVPHDLDAFDKALEEFQIKLAEREQLQGKDVGKLQMKLSSNAQTEPRIVDSYSNYLLFKMLLKYSYPYTTTTLSILELLFAVYDITGNTYLSCCREKRQQKQRDQQLKKADLKGYHSPDCQYFEYYCEIILTFTQYGRYRSKTQFIEELLQTIGPITKTSQAKTIQTTINNMTCTQHDNVFLQVHALLSKSLTEISIVARRARLAPHIYSNLYIYGQHQSSTIKYVLDELKGEDRYHLHAQDLAQLDYNIMSYIGNLGNKPGLVLAKAQQEQAPPFDRELIEVIQSALGYFFDFEANFFINQQEALAAALELENNPQKAQPIKTYTIDGGDVATPVINPNGCYWRFTRIKECIAYLNSVDYFWHHVIRLAYHLMNNNAMNPQMISIIMGTLLDHGLRYRPKQIRSIMLSLIYNIPGYFQGENAPSYPLLSNFVIKNVSSGNAVAASVQLKAPTKIETTTNANLTTTRTNTLTNSSTRSTKLSDDSSDDEGDDDKNSDYHFTTAAIGTANAIISGVEQDRLKQVRFHILNMADHNTIIRNVIAMFAFMKSLHVKTEEIVQREAKELKEIRKARKARQKAREKDEEYDSENEDDEESDDEEAEFFFEYEGSDNEGDHDEISHSAAQHSKLTKKEENGVVLKKPIPRGGQRFFMQFTENELSFINKFFNIPSSFECIGQFYKIYREFLTLYWLPDEEDEEYVGDARYKDASLDLLPVPPPLQLTTDPRLSIDKNKRGLDTNTLITPTNIAALTSKSTIPGKKSLPMALHALYPTQSSRTPLMIKCFEIELASYIVRYRDYNLYDPFSFIKDQSYKIIINHLQQFQAHKYFCYPELIVNISTMYFLAVARLNWQNGKYKDLLNKNPLMSQIAPDLNTNVSPSKFEYFPYTKLAQAMSERVNHETPWAQPVELTDIHIAAIDVFRQALTQYLVFYCSDNHHRSQTMTTVYSRIESHVADKDKPNKKQKYRHHIHSIYLPIQQPNHPWFSLTNSLLNPYAGFYTITDNMSFGGSVGTNLNTANGPAMGINMANTPYQKYSRQLRPDYIHIKTYTDFFEATVYDVNSLHTQYFHYQQQNPLHHDKTSQLRYKFQYNRDYTWALFEMMNFFHSVSTSSFFAKLRVSKPQMTSFVCKPYSRLYLTKLLTTYKDFVQRDNLTSHFADAQKYMVYHKHLVDVDTTAKGRAMYDQQRDSLVHAAPLEYQIGKENTFNFDMYTRLIKEADYGALNSHLTPFSPVGKENAKRLVFPEKVNSYNKHKFIEHLKTPPHSNIHGSGKDKINTTVKAAGDAAAYVEHPHFTMREQDLIYHMLFQNAINYYSIGEFKHMSPMDIDVAVWYIQNILLQRQQGISFKRAFLNLGHNFTPFSFDLTRILSSHINIFTVQLFHLLFDNKIFKFNQRTVNQPLPTNICTNISQRLPGQITLDELTHNRQQSTSTALYAAQRIPVWNHNLAHIDPPHHNVFNLLISHQFAYDPIENEPLHQLKLPTHALEHTPLTMYDHKMSNCLLIALSHVDNLSSTQATRLFAAVTSYNRQLSPILQRNSSTGSNSQQVISADYFNWTQQQPFLHFLQSRQSSLVFDLLELFLQQARKENYDPNIKHIIFNMLTKQTVVYTQLNVEILSWLLKKNAQINSAYINSLGNEVETLLISQHLFWNPAQVHTSLFNQLFDLFFKRVQYRKIPSILHINQLSRLCVITDILYHFRLPVYTSKRAQTTLLAFDLQDVFQQQLSLHQFQAREKDHKDSRENLDRSVAVVQQYLQLFNFNAPIVSAQTLSIIHDLLAMGRGFCSSCQAQSRYTQHHRHLEQLKHQEQFFEELKEVSQATSNPTPQQLQLRRKINTRGAMVDTAEELVAISKNVCSCQPILSAYQYFQGIVEDLIRKERYQFIQDNENHTWTPRVTVAQALYDIMFYYNIYQSNVQNTNARRYIDKLNTEGKPLSISTQHINWIGGIADLSQGDFHNLPKHQMPDVQGVTSFSFNNKYVNVVHALVNHPIDKIRSIFSVSKIYPNKTVNFDVHYTKAPVPYNGAEKADSATKCLTNVGLEEFLNDWYEAVKPTDELLTQIHQLLTSFNNTTVGLLPNNTMYTAYDGSNGFFYYILNNVYQPTLKDIKALLPDSDQGLFSKTHNRIIFRAFFNEFNPETPIVNNAKQTVMSNILLRRWNKECLEHIFNHKLLFGGPDTALSKAHFEYQDMFSCGLADYMLSTNTFNYAFHLCRPYILKYYQQDPETPGKKSSKKYKE